MIKNENGRYDWIFLFVLGAAISLIPCIFNPRFYFIDDTQNEFMPAFYNIGRSLRWGAFPVLTLTNWLGGNYLAEYQYALFNPVSLLTYLILPSISSLSEAAAGLACFYQAILAAGVYVLARNYGINRPAAWLAAVTIVTNNFIGYWFAAAWLPLLVATAWFVWAWAYLIKSHESSLEWFAGVFFSYLMMSAGSPHTDIVFGFLSLLLFFYSLSKREYSKAFAVGSVVLAATLLCMPSFIPVLSVIGIMGRSHEVFNEAFLVPNLYDLLALSSPFSQGFMHLYSYPLDSMVPHNGVLPAYTSFRRMSTPFLYCAWYIFPLLPLISFKKIDWRDPSIVILATMACALAVGTQGPDHLTILMAPFRFVPYFHIAVVILFLKLLTQYDFRSLLNWRSVRWSLALICLTGLMAFQTFPRDDVLILFGLIVSMGGFFFFVHGRTHGNALMFFILGLTTVLIFVISHIYFPANTDLVDWNMNATQGKKPLKGGIYDAYTFYDGGPVIPICQIGSRNFRRGICRSKLASPKSTDILRLFIGRWRALCALLCSVKHAPRSHHDYLLAMKRRASRSPIFFRLTVSSL